MNADLPSLEVVAIILSQEKGFHRCAAAVAAAIAERDALRGENAHLASQIQNYKSAFGQDELDLAEEVVALRARVAKLEACE